MSVNAWDEPVEQEDDWSLPVTTELDPRRRKAAELLAIGEMSTPDIAAEIGVTRQTVWAWSKEPAVKLVVKQINDALDAETFKHGLNVRRNRVKLRGNVAMRLYEKIMAGPKPNTGWIREFSNLLDAIDREMTKEVASSEVESQGAPPIRQVTIYLQHEVEPAPQSEYEQSAQTEGFVYEPTEEQKHQWMLVERERYRAEMDARGR